MVSPFLLRDVLDQAIPEKDRALLLMLVGGMVAISVATGVLGVGADLAVQPRRPARDARPARAGLPAPAAAVARVLHPHPHGRDPVAHRQRHRRRADRRDHDRDLDRLQRDDRGGERRRDVPPGLAARRCSRWRVLPFFVFLSRRVGAKRRAITATKQGAMADISSLVQESLSVSGILLGKSMGRGRPRWPTASTGESRATRRPRGPLADGRALDDGLDPDLVRGHAGARLPVRGAVAERGRRSAPWSPSPRCRRGCSGRSRRC